MPSRFSFQAHLSHARGPQNLELGGPQHARPPPARPSAAALRVNQTVREVVLSGNGLANQGTSAIADALRVNCFIQRLDLSRCALIHLLRSHAASIAP